MSNYPTVSFNNVEKKFLSTYKPEDRTFTSIQEMDDITKVLGLKGKTYKTLQAIRNSVVDYYSNRIELAGDNNKEIMNKWMPAMQSITAVIDDVIIKKYGSL